MDVYLLYSEWLGGKIYKRRPGPKQISYGGIRAGRGSPPQSKMVSWTKPLDWLLHPGDVPGIPSTEGVGSQSSGRFSCSAVLGWWGHLRNSFYDGTMRDSL